MGVGGTLRPDEYEPRPLDSRGVQQPLWPNTEPFQCEFYADAELRVRRQSSVSVGGAKGTCSVTSRQEAVVEEKVLLSDFEDRSSGSGAI